ncbi:hypothetical protein ACS0VU_15885 [Aliiroseovarius sp. KMU-71]|uniref:hypothetical protein n=1 Tax=Aliiroseovarius sp. KMU-71 TaxID=3453123 RepID=UPI003F486E55
MLQGFLKKFAFAARPNTPEIRVPFPHGIKDGSASLKVTPRDWELEFLLFGPDLRYNSTIWTWPSYEFEKNRQIIKQGWDRYNDLKSQKPTKNLTLEEKISDGLAVYLNYYAQRNGVCLWGHEIFSDKQSYESFMKALDWCEKKGPELTEFSFEQSKIKSNRS